MKPVNLLLLCSVVLLCNCTSSNCTSKNVRHSDPTAIWAHPDYAAFESGMKDAVARIQAGQIIIPLASLYDHAGLRSALLALYGIKTIDARNWRRGYDTAYNQVMSEAAKNKFGEEWWSKALRVGKVPLPPLPD